MKRTISLVATIGLIVVVIVFALQPQPSLPLLDWAKKAAPEKARIALLLEFGHKDVTGSDWSGRAVVTGAKVVHREGYRFRDADKVQAEPVDKDGATVISWQAKTRPPVRAPRGMPAITKLEPVATVGVVLHLENVDDKTTLSILHDGTKQGVVIDDVLAGKTQTLFNGGAVVRLITTATPIATTKLEEDFPAACHAPDGTLWVAYIAYKNRDESRRIEAPQLKEQPKDFKAYYKPELADRLYVKSYKAGKWSEPIAIMRGEEDDLVRCAIAANADGSVHVAYSHNSPSRAGNNSRMHVSHIKIENGRDIGGSISNVASLAARRIAA